MVVSSREAQLHNIYRTNVEIDAAWKLAIEERLPIREVNARRWADTLGEQFIALNEIFASIKELAADAKDGWRDRDEDRRVREINLVIPGKSERRMVLYEAEFRPNYSSGWQLDKLVIEFDQGVFWHEGYGIDMRPSDTINRTNFLAKPYFCYPGDDEKIDRSWHGD